MKGVSIIIINYCTFDLTKNAINSIHEKTRNLNYEIILLDNNSPDGSGEMLRETFNQKITYIQTGFNAGTSKAFNIGLKNARYDYILWLNSDILLLNNYIEELFEFMENHNDCGICGGNLFDADNKPMHSFYKKLCSIKTIRKEFSILHMLCSKFRKKFYDQFNYTDKPMQVGFITGTGMMTRKEIIDDIGGLDENLFMYFEDMEFSFRVKNSTNYKIYSVPTAKMIHLDGASFKTNDLNEFRFKCVHRSGFIYFKKSYGDEYIDKYYKVKIKQYKKEKLIYSFMLRFDKVSKVKKKISLFKEIYNEFRK